MLLAWKSARKQRMVGQRIKNCRGLFMEMALDQRSC